MTKFEEKGTQRIDDSAVFIFCSESFLRLLGVLRASVRVFVLHLANIATSRLGARQADKLPSVAAAVRIAVLDEPERVDLRLKP